MWIQPTINLFIYFLEINNYKISKEKVDLLVEESIPGTKQKVYSSKMFSQPKNQNDNSNNNGGEYHVTHRFNSNFVFLLKICQLFGLLFKLFLQLLNKLFDLQETSCVKDDKHNIGFTNMLQQIDVTNNQPVFYFSQQQEELLQLSAQ